MKVKLANVINIVFRDRWKRCAMLKKIIRKIENNMKIKNYPFSIGLHFF